MQGGEGLVEALEAHACEAVRRPPAAAAAPNPTRTSKRPPLSLPLTRQAVHGGEDALKVLALELLERGQRVLQAGAAGGGRG